MKKFQSFHCFLLAPLRQNLIELDLRKLHLIVIVPLGLVSGHWFDPGVDLDAGLQGGEAVLQGGDGDKEAAWPDHPVQTLPHLGLRKESSDFFKNMSIMLILTCNCSGMNQEKTLFKTITSADFSNSV